MPSASRLARDDRQLDLFSFKAWRVPTDEAPDPIRANGRETLAPVSAQDDGRPGGQGQTALHAPGGGGEDRGGTGLVAPTLHSARLDPGTSPRPGLGDRAGEVHLPEPGVLTSDRHAEGGESVAVEEVAAEPEPPRNQRNYRISDADRVGAGSLKRKCLDNLEAIELFKRLEGEGRSATEREKRVLVHYVGWGGLPQVFNTWNDEWKEQRERLEQLLTPDELESARATTLNAHYTAPVVVQGMYAALQRLGFTHGRVLEPALGLGHFIGLMPEEMHARSLITGIEIDSVTARLAKQLYPDADIRYQPFEASKLADGFYDVAIGNVPFGDHCPYDPRFKAWKFLIHDYFFAAALHKIRPGGLILFITSKGTLDKHDSALREYVANQADLIGAIRLPNDAFKRNANTEVTTDIVILRKRLSARQDPGDAPGPSAYSPGCGAGAVHRLRDLVSGHRGFRLRNDQRLGGVSRDPRRSVTAVHGRYQGKRDRFRFTVADALFRPGPRTGREEHPRRRSPSAELAGRRSTAFPGFLAGTEESDPRIVGLSAHGFAVAYARI
jgi:hypothetical protein